MHGGSLNEIRPVAADANRFALPPVGSTNRRVPRGPCFGVLALSGRAVEVPRSNEDLPHWRLRARLAWGPSAQSVSLCLRVERLGGHTAWRPATTEAGEDTAYGGFRSGCWLTRLVAWDRSGTRDRNG